MVVEKTNIEGVLVIHPGIFGDERGYFLESFNSLIFEEKTQLLVDFVQDNESKSKKGVLRGLHFQRPPFAQGKLVRVVKGRVLDVVLDIRKSSKTYGQFFSISLDGIEKKQLWIPPGLAHGFVCLEDDTIFAYKCTEYYNPSSEGCILWNDQNLNINWGISNPIISEKDSKGVSFSGFDSPFE